MSHLSEFDFNALYPAIIADIAEFGEPYAPREYECLELRPGSFELYDPTLALCSDTGRRLNYRFFVVETLGYIAGLEDKWYMDLLCAVNSRFEKFRDPRGKLLSAYGPLLYQSLREVCELLTEDVNSRQAVCSLWSPGIKSKINANTLCTCLLHFMSTHDDGELTDLSLSVYMRSNDVDWGTPYDVAAFCAIQCMMAGILQKKPGVYSHRAGSLHMYSDHQPQLSGEYLSERFMIPVPDVDPNYLPIAAIKRLQYKAEEFLHLLADHVADKKPYKDFELPRHFGEDYLGDNTSYWQFWVDLVRFRWGNTTPQDI